VDGFALARRRILDDILANAWSGKLGSFTGCYGGSDLDASLLQMATLRFLPPGDARIVGTIEAIQRGLTVDGWLVRYRLDGLGVPDSAFVLCTFWLIEALVEIGRVGAARQVMEHAKEALSPLGLLAEDYQLAPGDSGAISPSVLTCRTDSRRLCRRPAVVGLMTSQRPTDRGRTSI
jgi:GH15 family glucan-1,4-alpha-glucosidase